MPLAVLRSKRCVIAGAFFAVLALGGAAMCAEAPSGAGSVAIATASLARGHVGLAYNETLSSEGGKAPYTWSVKAGALPQGLSLESTTGIISGEPKAAGTASVTIRMTDSASAVGDKQFTIAIGNVVHVSTTGDDKAAGTREAPYKTIMRGFVRLQPGDLLAIGAGNYKEPVSISVRGTQEDPVGIICQNGVVLVAAAADGIAIKDTSYLTIQGLQVGGAEHAAISISNSDHVTISQCIVTENAGYGVISTLSDFVTIEKSEVSNSKVKDGIYLSSTNHPTITDNKIKGNAQSGIYLNGNMNEGGNGMITGANISRNTITDNGQQGGAGIRMDGVERSMLERNVVDHNYAGGIASYRSDAASGGINNKFIGNMIRFASGAGAFGIVLRDGSYKATVSDSIIAIDNGPSLDVDNASAKGFRASNNFYPSPGKTAKFVWKGEMMSFDQWKTASGQDEDSHTATVDAGYGPGPGAPPAGAK
jgi:parallel beta-helix repeat protein